MHTPIRVLAAVSWYILVAGICYVQWMFRSNWFNCRWIRIVSAYAQRNLVTWMVQIIVCFCEISIVPICKQQKPWPACTSMQAGPGLCCLLFFLILYPTNIVVFWFQIGCLCAPPSVFSFQDNYLIKCLPATHQYFHFRTIISKYQWIFTKLGMCIDILEILFGIDRQISSICFRVICPWQGIIISHIYLFVFFRGKKEFCLLFFWEKKQTHTIFTDFFWHSMWIICYMKCQVLFSV